MAPNDRKKLAQLTRRLKVATARYRSLEKRVATIETRRVEMEEKASRLVTLLYSPKGQRSSAKRQQGLTARFVKANKEAQRLKKREDQVYDQRRPLDEKIESLKENIRRVKAGKKLGEENPLRGKTKKVAKKPRRRNRTIIKRAKRVIVLNSAKKKRVVKRRANSAKKTVQKRSRPAAAPRRRNANSAAAKRRRTLSTRSKNHTSSRKSARRPKRQRNAKRASPQVRALREKFTGTKSTKSSTMTAPNGTPRNLAKLGRVVSIKAKKATIKPSRKNPTGGVWLCADARGKLHLCTTGARLIEGPARSFGEVREIEYEAAKPHLGHKRPTIFFHKLGEEGGRRPELVADGNGGLKFKGGDYTIESEGIRN
jgi:hypothetical protein